MLNIRKTDSATLSHARFTDVEGVSASYLQQFSAIKALAIWHGVICDMDQNFMSLLILGSALF